MKAGPVLAMVVTLFIGMWLVLQPALNRKPYDFTVLIGAKEFRIERAADGFIFVSPDRLNELGAMSGDEMDAIIGDEIEAWHARPPLERTLMGFFNISEWANVVWVAVGLLGQGAFFGRLLAQWVVSERSGESQVPEIFWWFSLIGGVALFTYFVWRIDVVGVMGQSTGLVIYVRNLWLIHKQKDDDGRNPEGTPPPGAATNERPA